MESKIEHDTVILANPSLIVRNLDGQTALFERNSKQCYRLDPIGSRIWSALREPATIGGIVEMLVGEYDVDRSRCEDDLAVLILELADAGLIEVKPAACPTASNKYKEVLT